MTISNSITHYFKDEPEYSPQPVGIVTRLATAMKWLVNQPRRWAVLDELSTLSDRELEDIGLNRGDLPKVFNAGFAASRNLARCDSGRSMML